MDATCAATVTATKPCGKPPKTKLKGKHKILQKLSLDEMKVSAGYVDPVGGVVSGRKGNEFISELQMQKQRLGGI